MGKGGGASFKSKDKVIQYFANFACGKNMKPYGHHKNQQCVENFKQGNSRLRRLGKMS